MYKKLTLVIIMIMTLNIVGCANKEIEYTSTKEYTHEDLFEKLNISEIEQEMNTEHYYEEIEDINPHDEYKESFVSNIDVDIDAIYDTDFEQSWLVLPEDKNFQDNVYQWITYAIYKYYNGNITETFNVNLNTDIIESYTNMIFTVRVTGETHQLDILLDMYNNKIIVTEVE